jgi:uncharacterized membrane protein
VTNWLEVLVYALAGITMIVTVVFLVRNEAAANRDWVFALLGVTELVLLVQLVLGCVALANTERDVAGALFVSYLVGVALVLPIGAFWSLAERNRAGTAVLLLAAFAVLGLELRLDTIWAGAGA